MTDHTTRREILSGLAVAAPAIALGAGFYWRGKEIKRFLHAGGENLSYRAHRLIAPDAMAREYAASDISGRFPTNGSTSPDTEQYRLDAANRFRNWELRVHGMVARPQAVSLAQLRAMPARTQITRHDCVEGWSAIAQWTGVPLGDVLARAEILPGARFVVFHCADVIGGFRYYKSLDLVDAFHPQTILAYAMNGAPLPMGHGAPLRLRVERQLGYKHAKYVMEIEAVETLALFGMGKGGFWEDMGDYEWYAGI